MKSRMTITKICLATTLISSLAYVVIGAYWTLQLIPIVRLIGTLISVISIMISISSFWILFWIIVDEWGYRYE